MGPAIHPNIGMQCNFCSIFIDSQRLYIYIYVYVAFSLWLQHCWPPTPVCSDISGKSLMSSWSCNITRMLVHRQVFSMTLSQPIQWTQMFSQGSMSWDFSHVSLFEFRSFFLMYCVPTEFFGQEHHILFFRWLLETFKYWLVYRYTYIQILSCECFLVSEDQCSDSWLSSCILC